MAAAGCSNFTLSAATRASSAITVTLWRVPSTLMPTVNLLLVMAVSSWRQLFRSPPPYPPPHAAEGREGGRAPHRRRAGRDAHINAASRPLQSSTRRRRGLSRLITAHPAGTLLLRWTTRPRGDMRRAGSQMTELALTVLPETPADADVIERLHERTFGPGRYARTAFRIREGAGHLLGLSFTARIGTLLVGSVRLTPIRIGEFPALL